MNIIDKTFIFPSDILPNLSEIRSVILTDDKWENINFNSDKYKNCHYIRDKYVKFNFSILTHEFFIALKKLIFDINIKKVAEIQSGAGWLTFWAKKYGIEVFYCIDDFSWEYKQNSRLPHVKKHDSIKFTKEHTEIDLFILSWPYMDQNAFEIWQAINSGTYLLYIGEDYGGCTADDNFFKATSKWVVEDKWELYKTFISFWGVHDRPILYQKP